MGLAAVTRFVIALHLGPRTLDSARELLASVARCCPPGQPLLIEADEHRPYPQAILDVFGVRRHRRRRRGRGRHKHPDLKAPRGLMAGVVHKVRDARGNLVKVTTRRLFGRKRDILHQVKRLKLGWRINTSHIERFNGTLRTQQTRLARRTRNVSHKPAALAWALSLWRDLYPLDPAPRIARSTHAGDGARLGDPPLVRSRIRASSSACRRLAARPVGRTPRKPANKRRKTMQTP